MQQIIPQQFRQEDADYASDNEQQASRSHIQITRLDTIKAHDDMDLVSPCLAGIKSNNKKLIKQMLRKMSDESTQSFKNEINQFSDDEKDTADGSSCNGQSKRGFNDTQSMMSKGALSQIALPDYQNEDQKSNSSSAILEEKKLTEAERESFFAPQTLKVTATVFKPTITEFVPTQPKGFMQKLEQDLLNTQYMDLADEEEECSYEPAYKIKEKTELCKFWLGGQQCKFGDECAFAHGEEQLEKKQHVASKYKQTLCNSYMNGHCLYGNRCQFVHTTRDFSDFHSQRTSYQNLLDEDSKIMKQRIDTVANPDIDSFGIAMPSNKRLTIFDSICPVETKRNKKNKKSNGQKKNSSKKAQKINLQIKQAEPKTRVICLSEGEDAPTLSQVFGQ